MLTDMFLCCFSTHPMSTTSPKQAQYIIIHTLYTSIIIIVRYRNRNNNTTSPPHYHQQFHLSFSNSIFAIDIYLFIIPGNLLQLSWDTQMQISLMWQNEGNQSLWLTKPDTWMNGRWLLLNSQIMSLLFAVILQSLNQCKFRLSIHSNYVFPGPVIIASNDEEMHLKYVIYRMSRSSVGH